MIGQTVMVGLTTLKFMNELINDAQTLAFAAKILQATSHGVANSATAQSFGLGKHYFTKLGWRASYNFTT